MKRKKDTQKFLFFYLQAGLQAFQQASLNLICFASLASRIKDLLNHPHGLNFICLYILMKTEIQKWMRVLVHFFCGLRCFEPHRTALIPDN